MPRRIGSGRGYRAEGVYERLLAQDCRREIEVGEFDPRHNLDDVGADVLDRRRALVDEAGARLLEERLEAALPILVPKYRIAGGPLPEDAPAWWSDRVVTWVTITADDVVAPG